MKQRHAGFGSKRSVRKAAFSVFSGLWMMVALGALLPAASHAAMKVWRGEYELPKANYREDDAIFIENEMVRLVVGTDVPVSGQVIGFLYKPTGQELSPEMTNQGYFKDRFGEGRTVWRNGRDHKGEILEQSDEKVVVRYSYVWPRPDSDTDLRVSKTYTLHAGSTVLFETWRVENIGETPTAVTPWIKHVGGRGSEEKSWLSTRHRMLKPEGAIDGAGGEQEITTNWHLMRTLLDADSEAAPMVTAVYTFEDLLQFFHWGPGGSFRYTLEAPHRRVSIEPGEAWETTSALLATANLANPMYASPELVAGFGIEGDAKAGDEVSVTVKLAPAMSLGARRLEGVVRPLNGGAEITLPNREVVLEAGKIAEVPYTFTPPADGVYEFSLTVYREQQIQRLGEEVNSQRSSITLPVAVGEVTTPVVRAWKGEGPAWPTREERMVKPFRTLLNSEALRAGQIRVPGRLYPEDRLALNEAGEPATLRLAAGQHESLQFAVEVPEGKDVMDLEVSVSEMRNEAGGTLEDIELREVMFLKTDQPSGYRDYPVGAWPDPLFKPGWQEKIPNAPVTKHNLEIKRKTGRRVFWATVKTPRDAAPGVYRGEVVLRLAGGETGRFPVEVRVSDFTLPVRPSYRPSTGLVGFKGSRASNWEIMGLPPEKVAEIRKTAMDQYRAIILEYGWTPTMWWGLKDWKEWGDYGRGATSFATNAERGSETDRWLKENDLLKYAFTYAPFDEHTDAEVPNVVEWAKGFREKSDIPIGDCYYGSRVDPLIEWVDLWIGQSPRGAHWGEPTGPLGWGHKALKAKEERGVNFVAVNSSLIWFIETEPISGRAAFWNDFMTGLDGRYVYSTCRWTDDVYDRNWTSGNYMGCAVYPGPEGMTTSIRMETLRDGVYDFDTLALLRRRLVEARESGRAEALADTIAESERIFADRNLASRVGTVEELHVLREKIADLIEALGKK